MIKVLMVSELDTGNAYVDGLYNRLKGKIDIKLSVAEFWESNPADFQIVHIQWPEALFKWRRVKPNYIEELKKRLGLWRQAKVKIIVTRHNYKPHNLNRLYESVFDIVYSQSDVIIHLSNISAKDYIEDNRSVQGSKEKNRVIYHHLYDDIPNEVSRISARKVLGISENKKVILVFGRFRHKKERVFTKKVFAGVNVKQKLLVAPSWYMPVISPRKLNPLRYFRYSLSKLLKKNDEGFLLEGISVPESNIQLYMNAADVVFVPRFEVLNSGVPILAFTFNKIVVGPAVGSIGEMLDLTNNPAFKVGDVIDASEKIRMGLIMSGKRVRSHELASRYMNPELIVRQHLALYKEILSC